MYKTKEKSVQSDYLRIQRIRLIRSIRLFTYPTNPFNPFNPYSCSVGALETSAPPENSIRLIRCLKSISSKSVQSDYLRSQRIRLIRSIRCLKIISSKSVQSVFLLGWCTSCSGKRQSRAETSAPPENSIRLIRSIRC